MILRICFVSIAIQYYHLSVSRICYEKLVKTIGKQFLKSLFPFDIHQVLDIIFQGYLLNKIEFIVVSSPHCLSQLMIEEHQMHDPSRTYQELLEEISILKRRIIHGVGKSEAEQKRAEEEVIIYKDHL